ncbi:MAG: hypothetical protein WAL50_20065, partial [Kineosporiaceae bacterium]
FRPPTLTTGAIPARHPGSIQDDTTASSWARRARLVLTASPARSAGVTAAAVLTVVGLWQLPALFIGSPPVTPTGSTDVSQSSDGEALTEKGLTGPSSNLLSSPLATNVDDRIAARQPTQAYAQAPRRITVPRTGVTSASPSPKPSVKPSTTPTTVPSPSPSVIAVPPPSTGPSPSPSTTAPPTTPPPSTAPPTTPGPSGSPAGGG